MTLYHKDKGKEDREIQAYLVIHDCPGADLVCALSLSLSSTFFTFSLSRIGDFPKNPSSMTPLLDFCSTKDILITPSSIENQSHVNGVHWNLARSNLTSTRGFTKPHLGLEDMILYTGSGWKEAAAILRGLGPMPGVNVACFQGCSNTRAPKALACISSTHVPKTFAYYIYSCF